MAGSVDRGFLARVVGVALCGVLTGSMLSVPAVQAAPGGGPRVQKDRSVAVSGVPRRAAQRSDSDDAPWSPSPVVWPSTGSAVIDVSTEVVSGSRAAGLAGVPAVPVGGLPVRVSAVAPSPAGPDGDVLSGRFQADRADTSDVPGRVRVDVVRVEPDAERGLPIVLRVTRADGGSGGRVRLEVDYSAFRDAFGGDWSTRLRLVGVPACAGAAPLAPECGSRTGLGSVNNAIAQVATAEVDLAGADGQSGPDGRSGSTLALAAAADSNAGSFAKTSLAASYGWQAGLPGAGFEWSYPLRVPPAAGGLEPEVVFGYSTAAVDGRTNAEAGQNSWLGEGWDYQPGYIERRFRACADDNDDPNRVPHWRNSTGDLCWRDDNATLVWNGRSTELIRDDATGAWRPAQDDGSRVQKFTSGSVTGLWNNEHWRVTTQDGTQFWFGRTRLPGWTTGGRVTNSAWGVPVFANHSAEPGFTTGSFASSRAQVAWRWNLDHVVDPNGNSMSYWYTRNQSRTGLAGNASPSAVYDRGGWLSVLEYGTRTGNETTAPPPARLVFAVGDRCLSACWNADDSPNQPRWPDTPWDLHCSPTLASSCPSNLTPSFFSIKRLDTVTTQIRSGGAWVSVDEWSLDHTFPDTLEAAVKPALWLDDIVHTGKVGGSLAMPTVHFGGIRGDNRTDYNLSAGVPKVKRYRVHTITTETGGQVILQYNGSDCTPMSLPDPAQNGMRCFPQFYAPPDAPAGWSWWNKYRVVEVTERDLVGGSPDVAHTYAYTNGGSSTSVLWHHDDEAWGANLAKRSWSDFRGYSTVHVTSGAVAGAQTRSTFLYFRGLHLDRTDSGPGTRQVSVTTSTGVAMQDLNFRRGFLRERIDYNAPGGTPLRRQIYEPWTKETGARTESASHAQPSHFQSIMLRNAGGVTSTWLAHADAWRDHQVAHAFDDTYGTLSWTADFGDPANAGDTVCTRFAYPRNPTLWLVDYVGRTEMFNHACTATPSYPAQFLGEDRIFYDGNAVSDAAPTKGNITRTSEAYGHDGTNPLSVYTSTTTYDAHGRVLTAADALNRTTATAYTPATGGPTTSVKVTNPAGHVETTTLHPAWGEPTTEVDANGKTTTAAYDPLGRLTKVWLPGRAVSETPDTEHIYTVSPTVASRVQTRALGPNGNYISSYEIYDGLERLRQTQSTAPDGKRVVVDVAYDSRDLPVKESMFYNAASGPTGTLVTFADSAVGTQRRYLYDGLDREISDQLWSLGAEKWRTSTTYDGDRTTVDPPAGDTATTEVYDVHGRMTELRQYQGSGPSGAYDATKYGYDVLDRLTTVTDAANNRWTYTYDLRDRVTTKSDPDLGTTTLTYDDEDQLITTTDARGETLARVYDSLGRLTALRDDTPSGNLRASWTYDTLAKGLLSSSTRHHDGSAYTVGVTGYTNLYEPTGTTATIPPAEGDLAGTYTAGLTYRVDGSPATVGYPAAGGLPAETVAYTYTDAGYLSTAAGTDTYVSSAQYHFDGGLAQRTLGTGTKRARVTTSVEEATRLLSKAEVHTETAGSPNTWTERLTEQYTYDPAGNVTSIAETTAGATVSNQCFSHDYLRRLTQAWTTAATACQAAPSAGVLGGPDPYWQSFTYDKSGNRTSETVHGAGTRTYTVPAAAGARPHTVTSIAGPAGTDSFTYDAAGNTTTRNLAGKPGQTLTWDPEGHLASLQQGSSLHGYLYTADGDRLLAHDPGVTTVYLGHTELRHHTATDQVTATRYYPDAVRTTGGGLSYVLTDHHGTGQLAINADTLAGTRRKSLPFGGGRGTAPGSWPDQKGFVGGTTDPTGLTHLGAREYDPTTGRFLSIDPLIDDTDPQQMHGYAYANNNPTTYTDPDGHIRKLPSGGGGGGGSGGHGIRGGTGGGTRGGNGGGVRGSRPWIRGNPQRTITKISRPVYHRMTRAQAQAHRADLQMIRGYRQWLNRQTLRSTRAVKSTRAPRTVPKPRTITNRTPSRDGTPKTRSPRTTQQKALKNQRTQDYSRADVDRVAHHLARPELDPFPANNIMIARIRQAISSGRAMSDSQRNFMRHELTEARLMDQGMCYTCAHRVAGRTHPPGRNYDRDLIDQFPQFGPWWRRMNDLEPR